MSSAKKRRGAEGTLSATWRSPTYRRAFRASPAPSGHASARIPGTDTFLMPTRRSPGLASASTLAGSGHRRQYSLGQGTPNSELWIHARIYAARPDVAASCTRIRRRASASRRSGSRTASCTTRAGRSTQGVPEYEQIS